MVWFYHTLDHRLLFIVLIVYVLKKHSFFDGTIGDTEVETVQIQQPRALKQFSPHSSRPRFSLLLSPSFLPPIGIRHLRRVCNILNIFPHLLQIKTQNIGADINPTKLFNVGNIEHMDAAFVAEMVLRSAGIVHSQLRRESIISSSAGAVDAKRELGPVTFDQEEISLFNKNANAAS